MKIAKNCHIYFSPNFPNVKLKKKKRNWKISEFKKEKKRKMKFPPHETFFSDFQTMCSFIFILCNHWIFRWTMPTTIIYISSTMGLAFYFYSKSHTLLRQTWLPILVLLTQPHNMILLPFHICLENVIKRLQFNSKELANVYNFFGWTLFFQLVCKIHEFWNIYGISKSQIFPNFPP